MSENYYVLNTSSGEQELFVFKDVVDNILKNRQYVKLWKISLSYFSRRNTPFSLRHEEIIMTISNDIPAFKGDIEDFQEHIVKEWKRYFQLALYSKDNPSEMLAEGKIEIDSSRPPVIEKDVEYGSHRDVDIKKEGKLLPEQAFLTDLTNKYPKLKQLPIYSGYNGDFLQMLLLRQ